MLKLLLSLSLKVSKYFRVQTSQITIKFSLNIIPLLFFYSFRKYKDILSKLDRYETFGKYLEKTPIV